MSPLQNKKIYLNDKGEPVTLLDDNGNPLADSDVGPEQDLYSGPDVGPIEQHPFTGPQNLGPIDRFINARLHQLSGEETGILNPNPQMNPVMDKPLWEPMPRNKRYTNPELFPEDNRKIQGKVADAGYDILAQLVNQLTSPLNIYGIGMGANPADMSLHATGAVPELPRPGTGGGPMKAAADLTKLHIVPPTATAEEVLAGTMKANRPTKLQVPEPKVGEPPYNTSQFGLTPSSETLPYPLNIVPNRLRPAGTNATVFNSLVPERYKLNEQGAALPPTTAIEPTGPEIVPARELPDPIKVREAYENQTGLPVTSEQQAKVDAVLKESPIPEVKPVQAKTGEIKIKPIVPTERSRSEVLNNDPIYQAAKADLIASGRANVERIARLADEAVARNRAADAIVNKTPSPSVIPEQETFLRGSRRNPEAGVMNVGGEKGGSFRPGEGEPKAPIILYRGEQTPGTGRGLPEWLKSDPHYQSIQQDAEGRWFTDNLEDAKWYAKEAGNGRIRTLELNPEEAAQFAAENHPEASKFSRAAGEYFLPRDIADRALNLLRDETGELKIRGIKKEDVAQVRASILDHLVKAGRPDVERIWKTFEGNLKRPQFDKILDDIIDSGDLRRLAGKAKEQGYVGDTNPPPMQPTNPAGDALDALMTKVKEHVVARNEQDILVREEKYRRISNAREANTAGIGGHYAALRELRGEYPKVSVADLMDGINPADIDAIKNQIYAHPDLDYFAKINATNAFLKAIGKMPSQGALQPGEIHLLDSVFGSNLTDDLIEMHGGLGFGNSEAFKNFVNMGNDYKSLKSAWDIGWPFRQGKFYVGTKAWKSAVVRSSKSYFSERLGENEMKALREKPRYSMWLDEGLSLSDFHSKRAALRDEAVPSDIGARLSQTGTDLYNLKEKLGSNGFLGAVDSALGKVAGTPFKLAGWGVNASDRAITVGMDHLRIDNANRLYDAFDRLYNASKEMAEAKGASAKEIADLEELNPANPFRQQKIIKLVNDSTARGKLPFGMEKSSEFWNTLLFSPKMRSGNMRTLGKLLNPQGWQKMTGIEKKLAVQQVASLAAVLTSTYGLSQFAKHVMGHKSEMGTDPTSSDFGKMILDDKTRLDPAGGLSQIVVPIAQLMTGETTSSTSDKTRKLGSFGASTGTGLMEQFLIDKQLAPMGAFVAALMNRGEMGGRPLDFRSANPFENSASRILANPMIFQDAWDIWQSDPSLLPLLLPDAAGMNVTTYQDLPKDKSIKMNNFNKEFQDSLRQPLGNMLPIQ